MIIPKHADVFILPAYEELMSDIAACFAEELPSEVPASICLYGETGVGKTTFIETMLNSYNHSNDGHGGIIYVESPSPATIKNLAAAILKAVGDPFPFRGSIGIQTDRIITLARRKEITAVVIDELQHFIDKKTDRLIHDVAEWLKSFINMLRLPVILVGLPSSERLLTEYSQIKRRVNREKVIEGFCRKPESIRNAIEFVSFLLDCHQVKYDAVLIRVFSEILVLGALGRPGLMRQIIVYIKRELGDWKDLSDLRKGLLVEAIAQTMGEILTDSANVGSMIERQWKK